MTKKQKQPQKHAALNLRSLYNYYAKHPESTWIMQPDVAPHLYKFIKANNFKKILDLGTGIGCTAAIIALTLEEKGVKDYEIHTVEQYDKCRKIAEDIIPKILKKNITFYTSEAIVWKTQKIPYRNFLIYKEIPEGDFDLILVDGPGEFVENKKLINLPSGDVLKMHIEDKIKPGTTVAWDGRIASLQFIEKFFADNFYIVPISSRIDFNVIERKEGKVSFHDELYEGMEKLGYFGGIDGNPIVKRDKPPLRTW